MSRCSPARPSRCPPLSRSAGEAIRSECRAPLHWLLEHPLQGLDRLPAHRRPAHAHRVGHLRQDRTLAPHVHARQQDSQHAIHQVSRSLHLFVDRRLDLNSLAPTPPASGPPRSPACLPPALPRTLSSIVMASVGVVRCPSLSARAPWSHHDFLYRDPQLRAGQCHLI